MKIWHLHTQQKQDTKENSFIGGIPKLPPEFVLPITEKTGTQMTFYFQYEFPKKHIYEGYTLSIFATSDFMDEDFVIPEMLNGVLKGIAVPKGFLDEYQRYFKLYVYKNGDYSLRDDYLPVLTYKKLLTSEDIDGDNGVYFGNISEIPDWYLDDETPGNYDETQKLFFLFQIKEGYEFEKEETAPRQKVFGDEKGTIRDSFGKEYSLFASNEIYFFGTDNTEKKIYIITQC